MDHSTTDQTSILRFIEDNWRLGQIGNRSFDVKAGSMSNLFNFSGGNHVGPLYLNPSTGETVRDKTIS